MMKRPCVMRAYDHYVRSVFAESDTDRAAEECLMWWWLFDAAMMGEI